MSIKTATANKWKKEPLLSPWLEFQIEDDSVTKIFCKICKQFESRIKIGRNFSKAFLNGVTGNAIKHDAVVKHAKSDQHALAMKCDSRPYTLFSFTETHLSGGP